MYQRKQTNSFLGTQPTTPIFLVLVVTLILLFSTFITSSHFHDDLGSHTDCTICNFANDLAGGDKHQALSLIPQEILQAISVIPQTVSAISLDRRVVAATISLIIWACTATGTIAPISASCLGQSRHYRDSADRSKGSPDQGKRESKNQGVIKSAAYKMSTKDFRYVFYISA